MTRNMIGANQALFKKFKARFPAIARETNRRFLVTADEEKRWLREVQFEQHSELEFSDVQAIYLCHLDGNTYLITKNIPRIASTSIHPQQMNAGLFVAAIAELPFSVRLGATQSEVEEIPLREFDDGEKNAGYELQEIVDFFDDIALYSIPNDSPLLQPGAVFRVGIEVTIDQRTQLYRLPFRPCSFQQISNIIQDKVENFPLHLLLRALHERRWDQAFLNIYKCLEQLFPLFKIEQLRQGLHGHLNPPDADTKAPSVKLFDLAVLAESHLGWRAHEEDSMLRLFSKLPAELIDELSCYLGIDNSDHEKKSRKVAETIYRIRNSAVHFRPGNIVQSKQVYPSDHDHWESVFATLLKIVVFLYTEYGCELHPDHVHVV